MVFGFAWSMTHVYDIVMIFLSSRDLFGDGGTRNSCFLSIKKKKELSPGILIIKNSNRSQSLNKGTSCV
jgi:hypothetical protein